MSTIPQLVKVEVVGPRVALKKINQMSPVFTVDLTSARAGRAQAAAVADRVREVWQA